jgi:hypothetical protein
MENADRFEVEVVYAQAARQRLITISVSQGTTVVQAIRLSGILAEFPELDERRLKVGIASRRVDVSQVLRAGDRIEIYRALLADPKSVRRTRALLGAARRKTN